MTVYEIVLEYGDKHTDCEMCSDERGVITSQIGTEDLPNRPEGKAGRCAAIGWAIDGAEQGNAGKGPFTVRSVEEVEGNDVKANAPEI